MLERVVRQGDAARRAERPGQAALRVRSARRTTVATSSSVSGSRRQTRIRDRSAELTSKYGFSVVAPMSVTVPSSTCGRRASCWALLKRWISSRNRTRAGAVEGQPFLRLGDRRADLGDAGHDRRQGREVGADLGGEEAGEARLAGPGRAPQQQRREVAARDAPAERAALADEVLLADELRRGRAGASARRAAAARAAAGRAPRGGRRSVAGRMACADGSAAADAGPRARDLKGRTRRPGPNPSLPVRPWAVGRLSGDPRPAPLPGPGSCHKRTR